MAELVEQNGITHALHPVAPDDTLCGQALEGCCIPTWSPFYGTDDDVEAAQPTTSKKITCAQCATIIRFAKDVPGRQLT